MIRINEVKQGLDASKEDLSMLVKKYSELMMSRLSL